MPYYNIPFAYCVVTDAIRGRMHYIASRLTDGSLLYWEKEMSRENKRDEEDALYVPRKKHLLRVDGGIRDEELGEEGWFGVTVPYQIGGDSWAKIGSRGYPPVWRYGANWRSIRYPATVTQRSSLLVPIMRNNDLLTGMDGACALYAAEIFSESCTCWWIIPTNLEIWSIRRGTSMILKKRGRMYRRRCWDWLYELPHDKI